MRYLFPMIVLLLMVGCSPQDMSNVWSSQIRVITAACNDHRGLRVITEAGRVRSKSWTNASPFGFEYRVSGTCNDGTMWSTRYVEKL